MTLLGWMGVILMAWVGVGVIGFGIWFVAEPPWPRRQATLGEWFIGTLLGLVGATFIVAACTIVLQES